MNFKEALIAHLQGERVEIRSKGEKAWSSFLNRAGFVKLEQISESWGCAGEYRLAPRTIMCNGVEVAAPEENRQIKHAEYFIPDPSVSAMYRRFDWADDGGDETYLQRGLIYLTKEDAIARAKAMLITS